MTVSAISAMLVSFVWLHTTYSAAQTVDYIGCYKDNGTTVRALAQRVGDVYYPTRVKDCQRNCKQGSLYTYFGNQFGNQCFCGETYSLYGAANESECEDCTEDKNQKCGAANHNSVYYVCPRGTFGRQCEKDCHCKDGGFCNRTGTCLNGTGCELGWKGDTCFEDINECEEKPTYCNQNCTNTDGSFYCDCYNDSYRLDAPENRTCYDIDECKEKTDNCAHNCLNTKGGYDCTCNPGYKTIDGGKNCTDIDECETNNGSCSHFCNNTIGSFSCRCPENLELSGDGKNCRELRSGGLPAWAIAVIVVGGVILLALVIFAIVYFYRRNHRTSSAKPNSVTKVKTTKSFRTLTDSVQKFARQTVYGKRPHSTDGDLVAVVTNNNVNKKNDAIGEVTGPLYENLAGSSDATRVKVNDLPKIVERIRENSQVLSKEFKKLPERIAEESCSFAEQKDLKSKNKYKNVLPYNSNRVLLSQVGNNQLSTYINASPIDGYRKEKKYIASHGPTAATLPDFWRMVWEHNVIVIIMLTKCNESAKVKCVQYWPSADKPVTDGNKLHIELSSTVEWADHIIRRLVIRDDNEKREVTQIQYTAWPDHGVPPYSIPLLAVRDKIRTLVKSNQADNTANQPLLIHCSAGVGRTGTYIALDNLLEEAEDKGEIDILNTVLSLRKQRMNCVQTLDQYTFIFKALLEGLTFGETRIPRKSMRERVESLTEKHTLTHTSVLAAEFNMLVEMQPPYTQEQCSDALSSKNISKNRDPKLVPSNDHRVLFMGDVNASKRYINAVMIPSHKKRDAYISTQLPLENTVEDFWQLCCDYKCPTVVVLSSDQSNDEDKSSIATMLPDSGKSLSLDHLTVETVSHRQQDKERDGGGKAEIYRVGIRSLTESKKSKESKETKAVAIYENTKADSGSLHRVTLVTTTLPSDVNKLDHALVDLVKTVSSLTKHPEESPVLVTCRSGVSLCGFFIAASNCDVMLQSDDVIDVVQIVLDLKKAQPHFIATEEEYELVYKIAAELSNNGSSRESISSSRHLDHRGSQNELTTLYENCRAGT